MQKCPFEAIQIINLPKDLDKDTTHRYGPNTFKLHRLVFYFFSRKKKKKNCISFSLVWQSRKLLNRLPVPRPGQVLGLVGTNGIGKSTALKVLAGKLKPNLGRFNVIFSGIISLMASWCISIAYLFDFYYFYYFLESSRLAGNLDILPRIWAAELFYTYSWR